MSVFKLKVVASNKTFFDGDCQSLTVPYVDGAGMVFMAHHENTVLPIEEGEMKIKDAEGNVTEAFVSDGVLEFLDNEGTLLCVSAELPEEIDARRAEEAKERAEEEMRQHQSVVEYHTSKANLARAMERLRVKNHH